MDGLEFNVSTLLRQGVGAVAIHDVDVDEPLVCDDVTATRIVGQVRLTRTNFGILARALFLARLSLECDRCLDIYTSDAKIDFSEEYLPVVDVSTGRPVQSERTDETFFISSNHVVDLTEAARQHILLAVPMHRICRIECKGLCPMCGVDKNTDRCTCSVEIEGPLLALAALLSESTPDS